MRVLLIEPDPDIFSFIKIGLEYNDIIIESESDRLPEENLPFSRHYDVIILDTEIAGELELEFSKKFINDRNTTPILMLTSIDCVENLIPSSETDIITNFPEFSSASIIMVPPLFVNFIAFETRFRITVFNISISAKTDV